MTQLHDNWRGLSIQQPWVDLILRRQKTIEVRFWRSLNHRGGFLLHSSSAIDWKTTELLGYEGALSLPLQRLVGYAEVESVIRLTNENRLSHLEKHWVVHPFNGEPLGAVLRNVIPFKHPIACRGRPGFFLIPPAMHTAVAKQLEQIGFNPALDPFRY
jgi:hypothetical protein